MSNFTWQNHVALAMEPFSKVPKKWLALKRLVGIELLRLRFTKTDKCIGIRLNNKLLEQNLSLWKEMADEHNQFLLRSFRWCQSLFLSAVHCDKLCSWHKPLLHITHDVRYVIRLARFALEWKVAASPNGVGFNRQLSCGIHKQPDESSWPLFANRRFFCPHRRSTRHTCGVGTFSAAAWSVLLVFCYFSRHVLVLSVFSIQHALFLPCCLNTSVFFGCPGQQGWDISRHSLAWLAVHRMLLVTCRELATTWEITDSCWSLHVTEHGISNHRDTVVSSFIRVSSFFTQKLH